MLRPRITIVFLMAILVGINKAVPVIQEDIVFYNDAVVGSGEIYGSVTVYDSPPETTTIDFYGQAMGRLTIYDSSTLNLYNGSAIEHGDYNKLYNSSTINVYEGALIGGGSGSCMFMYDSSTLNIYGGTVGLLLGTYDSSIINLYNGYLGISYIGDSSTLNVYKGYVADWIENIGVAPTATVNIYGYGFEYTPNGRWMPPIGGVGEGWWVSKLTGYAFGGDAITFWGLPDPATHDNINLIPEPMTFLLLGSGGLAFLRKRRRYFTR